jgi:hypothetical protein
MSDRVAPPYGVAENPPVKMTYLTALVRMELRTLRRVLIAEAERLAREPELPYRPTDR